MNIDYPGIEIRNRIKRMNLTNAFIIETAKLEMSAATFSNKLYGQRHKFTDQEVEKINAILRKAEDSFFAPKKKQVES